MNIQLRTKEQQATYFFNREFNSCDLQMLEKAVEAGGGYLSECVMQPSEEVLKKDFLSNYGYSEWLGEYQEEFGSWVYEREWYPMWSTVWRCEDFYIDSEYCDVDKLYNLGIGVIEAEDYGYFLFIAGAGYSFYDAHWIPLFEMIGWLEEETN